MSALTPYRVSLDLAFNTPALRWNGGATSADDAIAQATVAMRLCLRAIAYAQGADPEQVVLPKVSAFAKTTRHQGSSDWDVGTALFRLTPPKVGKRRTITAKRMREIFSSSFGPVVSRAVADAGYKQARINLTVGYGEKDKYAFMIGVSGLTMNEPLSFERPHAFDPSHPIMACALICAHAAQNAEPRSTSRMVDIRFDAPQSATMRAAAKLLTVFADDEQSLSDRALLRAVTGMPDPSQSA